MALSRIPRALMATLAILVIGIGGIGAVVVAQPGGGANGGVVAGGAGSFEVGGIEVDVSAKDATAARYAGWRLAQRKGWAMLSRRLGGGGGGLSDSALDSIVSGIVVENEEIGPARYVARLGVMFDRGRAASILGVSGIVNRSPPMLLVPIEWSGGAPQVFERRTDWQEAWGRFRTGNSSVDYVRASGTGPDSLLLNAGQINRPGRGWWRTVLAQYGASDVLIPIVRLYRQWPGGPIIGSFQARYGPDNRLLTSFALRVASGDALPALLDAGIKRIDDAYQSALRNGVLRVDPGLQARLPSVETAADEADATTASDEVVDSQTSSANFVTIQFETPGAATVEATEQTLRGIPGVTSAVTTSLALGGVSVMRVGYNGDIGQLAGQLESRGWQVTQGAGAIRIQRGRPSLPPPSVQPENATQG